MDVLSRGHVINNIIRRAKAYFSLLNMNPEAVILKRKKFYFEEDSYKQKNIWINILLFVVTVITTTVAGAESVSSIRAIVFSGLPYSITIMTILLSHEMGHYLAARYFGLKATLPYFIPFPSIVGTMGAIIKLKSPIQDRRVLLFVGAMGPIAGFILSLAASIVGIYLSEVKALPAEPGGIVPIFGDSLIFLILTKIIHGTIPQGFDIYFSPYAWAGWIGFLVTSLNLMPIGQLDGSRVIYALIGRKQLYVGWATLAGLIVLSFFWPGWILWIIMAFVFLMIGHPPVEDGVALSAGEKIMGWFCIIIFLLTFIPVPVTFI